MSNKDIHPQDFSQGLTAFEKEIVYGIPAEQKPVTKRKQLKGVKISLPAIPERPNYNGLPKDML